MSDQDYNEATYGDSIAEIYDEWYPEPPADMIRTLTDLAGAGPALELGIGTGRVALPLLSCGVEIHGIDASEAMVARLKSRPGGDRIPVTIGDFGDVGADVGMDGTFSLIFVVFNTFFSLLTQEEQVKCFSNIAGRLRPEGLFVMEAFIPDPSRFTQGQITKVTDISAGEVRLEVSKHDSLGQRTMSHHLVITEAGIKLYPVQVRYAWPAELDLMARLAGMRLRDRWSNWRREPLAKDSLSHISVYELIRPIS
jgi:SAM-dependent methyltransferase